MTLRLPYPLQFLPRRKIPPGAWADIVYDKQDMTYIVTYHAFKCTLQAHRPPVYVIIQYDTVCQWTETQTPVLASRYALSFGYVFAKFSVSSSSNRVAFHHRPIYRPPPVLYIIFLSPHSVVRDVHMFPHVQTQYWIDIDSSRG